MANKAKPPEIRSITSRHRPAIHGKKEDQVSLPLMAPDVPDVIYTLYENPGENYALAEWHRVTKIPGLLRILTHGDMAVLAQYCLLWDDLCHNPKTFGVSQHTQLRLCAVEMGMTPAARGKQFAPGKAIPKGSTNKFEEVG